VLTVVRVVAVAGASEDVVAAVAAVAGVAGQPRAESQHARSLASGLHRARQQSG